ncbi:MAG: HAD family hydrolase [Pseudomonadota bacterium]
MFVLSFTHGCVRYVRNYLVAAVLATAVLAISATAWADPLPSWRDGEVKSRLIAFVEAVSDPTSGRFVAPSERVAVFDNDGTLWAEQPVYFQLFFAADQLKAMAENDPSILTSDALKAAAAGDLKAALAGGEEALLEIVTVSHSNTTVSAFIEAAREWLATARHPETDMAFSDMVYQPMLELLRYLRDEGFDTYIVSGGGVHFMRAFTDKVYGIPPEQVIGSMVETSYGTVDGQPAIVKEPAIAFINDKGGKPVAIDRVIGRRPLLAVGNSDGDFAMLEWTTAGSGPRLAAIVHHTDAEREWAYDRDSHVGRLDRGLSEAGERGWLLIDMANDWLTVYPASAP